jgi:hypothetical protein
MLVDDDGKVYMYSGCSSNGNITGVERVPLLRIVALKA